MYFNGTKCCALLFGSLVSLSISLSAKDNKTAIEPQGLRKPLCFVENKGQVADEHNKPRMDIQYKLSAPGMSMYVGNGQLKYQFKKVEGSPSTSVKVSGYEMDVTLLGANPHAKATSADEQRYVENYYTAVAGDNGFTAHSFGKVIYKNIYHNIDWVLYVKNDKVEYDFVVRPGGNANDIKIKYDGATALSINKDGGISAETPMGIVDEKAPYSYETRSGKTVASKFVLKDNVIRFNTAACKGSLTIDPALQWSTYFGGPGEDVATAVQVGSGATYVGGFTAGAVTTPITGPFTVFAGGAYDAFIARYDTSAPPSSLGGSTILWSTYYGGVGIDEGTGVALDNAGGAVYLTGWTTSNTGISSPPAYHPSNGGLSDGFLVKFNSTTGTRTWGTFFGGPGDDHANAVACDAAGNVYITGQTASTSGIAFPTLTSALSGANDAFIAKFTSGGTIQWAKYYGGTAQENGTAIACDNTNSIVITGQTNSIDNIATTGAYQSTLRGFDDAFIAKYNTLGAQLWSTYFGGSGEETGNGVACDASNNIALIGNTSSADHIASSTNVHQPVYATSPRNTQDAFVTYFNSAGINVWSTYYGGDSADYGQGICFDAFNNVVITGATFSPDGIATDAGTPQPAINGSYDAFLSKFTPLGQQIWGTYFGSTLYDYANAVACNTTTDQITIAGYTSGIGTYAAGGISTFNTPQPFTGGGLYDGFVAEFKKDTFLLINQPFADTILCSGGTFTVPFTVYSPGVSYLPGNLFIVQLSDVSGSFAAPVTIGSGTASPIVCTVPNTPGTGYRIRIVANSPAFTSVDDYYNITITGTTLPAPAVAASTPVCLGNTLYLYSSAAYPIASYNWSGPGGYFSSLPDPVRLSVTYADSGLYTLITGHNGCPADTVSVRVAVNPFVSGPTPTDSASVTCDGSTLYLFANSGVPGSRYSWSGPDGFTSTLQNPTIPAATAVNSGVYTVVDTVASCQSAPTSLTVNVLPLVPTSSSISANMGYIAGAPGDTICAGTLVTFTATAVNGGFSPSYQWMTAPASPIVGAVAGTYSSATLLNGQTIYCLVTSSLSCPLPATTTTNSIMMNVINTPPLVYIRSSAFGPIAPYTNDTFTSSVFNGGTAPLYQWQLNHTDIPGATNSTYIIVSLTFSDTISLNVTSTMACATPNTATSNTIVALTNSGVTSIPSPLGNVDIFPNPNNGSFDIKGTVNVLNNSTVTLQILNSVGQVIYNGAATVANNTLNKSIDLKNIPDGIYLLHINAADQDKTFRFSVQH